MTNTYTTLSKILEENMDISIISKDSDGERLVPQTPGSVSSHVRIRRKRLGHHRWEVR